MNPGRNRLKLPSVSSAARPPGDGSVTLVLFALLIAGYSPDQVCRVLMVWLCCAWCCEASGD